VSRQCAAESTQVGAIGVPVQRDRPFGSSMVKPTTAGKSRIVPAAAHGGAKPSLTSTGS
jgi:hypothetical protein